MSNQKNEWNFQDNVTKKEFKVLYDALKCTKIPLSTTVPDHKLYRSPHILTQYRLDKAERTQKDVLKREKFQDDNQGNRIVLGDFDQCLYTITE